MNILIYFFKEAIRGFYQAKLMTVVSIMSIAVSLCFMNGVAVAFFTLERSIDRGTDQADIAAYLNDGFAKKDGVTDSLVDMLSSRSDIRKVVVISKDSAWERFALVYGKEMLEAVDENPLPVSLEFYLNENNRSREQIEKIAAQLRSFPEIESVSYSAEWISLLERFRFIFWIVVAVIAVIIFFILYFMIANTIKLTIYARKELVAHMQMVGATSFFIKMPFVLEGMLQGLIGAIICYLVIGILRLFLMGVAIIWAPQPLFFYVTVFMGVAFGWLGSMEAVRKFLE